MYWKRIDNSVHTCYTIITARETELNKTADVRKEEAMKKMTNEQARRFEELIRQVDKLTRKNKKLRKKLRKAKKKSQQS